MKITKRKLIKFSIFTILFFFSFNILAAPAVEAKTTLWNDQHGKDDIAGAYGDTGEPIDIRDITVQIIRIFLTFLSLIFVILIIWGGWKWMTSLGNEEKVREAKGQIKTSIYGIVIVLLAFGITEFIFYLIDEKFFYQRY